MLFYQDFKDTFVCYTQHIFFAKLSASSCFIRISKILLYAIHNASSPLAYKRNVVLSGFQRYFCMLYTTMARLTMQYQRLFYQDFKDTFVCYTQR